MVSPPTNWIFDIFSWEHLSAVVTVFALLTSTAFIPIRSMWKKRKAEREKQLDERETHKIKSISEEIMKPIAEKLNQHDDVVRDLQQTAKDSDRNTRETLTTIKDLVADIHNFKTEQYKINTKLYYQTLNLRQQSRGPAENNRGYRDWRIIDQPSEEEEDENGHELNGINP